MILRQARRFPIYIFLIIVIFLSASLVLIYRPLQVELKASLLENFLHQTENALIIFNNSIQACSQNAQTLSSRSAIRQKAYSFVKGEVPMEELVSFTSPKWRDGVEALEGVVYAQRSIAGKTIVTYGEEPDDLPLLEEICPEALIEYIRYRDSIAVYICSPITGKGTFMGYDLVLYDAVSLLQKLNDRDIEYSLIIKDDPEYDMITDHEKKVFEKDGLIVYYQAVQGSGLLLRSSIPSNKLYAYSKALSRKFTLWFAFFSILLAFLITFIVQKKNITQIWKMKELQSRIEESEARYRMLFDQGADMILVNPISKTGETGTFTQVNDMACKIMGYSREEFLHFSPEDILAPDSENSVDGVREKLLLYGNALLEITLLAKNGKRIPAEINVHLVNLEGRSIALSVIRDMTLRKVAERTLKASEHRYSSLFNDNDAVMILVDPETGIIRDANPSACSFYGYSRKDLVGRRFSSLAVLRAENDFFDLLDSANKGRKKHFELENKSAHGTVFNVEIYTTRIVFESGPVILFMIHDISEKVKAQDRARKLNEELLAISTTDKLTGIKNRRHMEEILDWEIDKSERYGDPLSLIMFDLDGFKSVNDTYGHGRGDEVLIRIARECGLHLRSSDFFGRWGGDEFLLVTPVPEESAVILAEKIRTIIQRLNLGVTASVGVASRHMGESRKSVLERADRAMYLAKQQGGNRVL